MSDTAKFESAQALFCAIADKVGKSNLDKVLNLETYKTFPDFVNSNKKVVNDSMSHIDVDVSYKDIQEFLTKKNSWYISSVKIAKKLLKDLAAEVDPDFKDMIKPGFQRNYLRGDKSVVQKITDLYNIANRNTNYNQKIMKISGFGDINKWSPADIYYASKKVNTDIVKHLTEANKDKSYSFDKLNLFISKLIGSGDLLPLSLKKAEASVQIKKVNFDMDIKAQLIDGVIKKGSNKLVGGLWHTASQGNGWQAFKKFPEKGLKRKSLFKTKYGEPINQAELSKQPSASLFVRVSNDSSRSSPVGFIQMRHDRSGASWKVDFSYNVGGGRGGSVVSDKMFAELLAFADSKVANTFLTAYKTGNIVYKNKVKDLKKYRKDIEELNKNQKENPTKYGKTLFPGKSPTSFDNMRGELSSIEVTNKVHSILQDWFNSNSKVLGDKPNKVDTFIRILYRYVTSRSETSAKFVIAK
jgi:hypothetical protein